MAKKTNPYEKNNRKTINKYYRDLLTRKDKAVTDSMAEIMQESMDYAMEIHEADGTHTIHLDFDKHYGWYLRHDGERVDVRLHRGELEGGLVEGYIESMLLDLPDVNWDGVLVAGMGDMGLDIQFEEDTLESVSDEAESDFLRRLEKKLNDSYRK